MRTPYTARAEIHGRYHRNDNGATAQNNGFRNTDSHENPTVDESTNH